MRWRLYRWVWQLRSPLHIGTTPAGSLNRTRLYIPARNIWAALTAEVARLRSTASFPGYQHVGQDLQENMRFSYLFPAEKVKGRWCAWLPRYEQSENAHGLFWHREDNGTKIIPDRRIRQRLLDTQPGTAIAPTTDSAEEGTLREVEYVLPYWRGETSPSDLEPVAFVGYVALNDRLDKHLIDEMLKIRELLVGGESRYGFGHLWLNAAADHPWEETGKIFGYEVKLKDQSPSVVAPCILAHGVLSPSAAMIQGDWEFIAGWNWGKQQVVGRAPLWQPGTRLGENKIMQILPSGLWEEKG